jgi:hypothetical protein
MVIGRGANEENVASKFRCCNSALCYFCRRTSTRPGVPGVTNAVSSYLKTGQTSGLYTFGLSGLAHAGLNPTQQFVGSSRWSVIPATGGLNMSLTNTTSFRSLTYDRGPQWQRHSFPTPMGNIHQTYNIFIPCN